MKKYITVGIFIGAMIGGCFTEYLLSDQIKSMKSEILFYKTHIDSVNIVAHRYDSVMECATDFIFKYTRERDSLLTITSKLKLK